MKYLKMLGLAAVSAMAMMAVTAGAASATTLEVGGAAKNEKITISASLKAGTSAVLQTTSGASANTCTKSSVSGTTVSPFTGATVTGPLATLTFEGCEHPVTVHKMGTLHVQHIAGTTDGTVSSSGAEVTVYTTLFGDYVNCKTGTGVDIGTLTGVTAHQKTTGVKHATMDIKAVLNCGFFLPSALWEGTYTVTSPTELGVVA